MSNLTITTELKSKSKKKQEVQLDLKVDARVEANWQGRPGIWFKGVITRASEGTYDVEYDDDTSEFDIPPERVKEVVKASLEERMSQRLKIREEEEKVRKEKKRKEKGRISAQTPLQRILVG